MRLSNLQHGLRASLALAPLVALVACGNGLGPATWNATPDTVVIYSLARPELIGQPSAYDFISNRRVVVEGQGQTGAWDAALSEQAGSFVLLPAGYFPGITSRAGIAETTSTSLDDLTRAPGDSAAYKQLPVTLRVGAVYAVRTRRDLCSDLVTTGSRYGKFQIVAIDASLGAITMASVSNPYCNNLSLVPPTN